ncbi:uncharacterized protein LOC126373388 isoform X2 [Pectinophora gossypiella]|nr:uncharacterized protein LOC126373388 isoform X2 [Pectinophora gossypiella]
MIFSSLALVFSSFLLNGSLKRNPLHIKVYYYFGVAFNIAALLMIISFSLFSVPVNSIVLMSAAFSFVSYALVLRMVRHTYQNLESLEVTDLPTCDAAEKSKQPPMAPEDYWEHLR